MIILPLTEHVKIENRNKEKVFLFSLSLIGFMLGMLLIMVSPSMIITLTATLALTKKVVELTGQRSDSYRQPGVGAALETMVKFP